MSRGQRIGKFTTTQSDAIVGSACFAADSLEALTGVEPGVPAAVHDRAADNWRPLLGIAELAGGGWPDRARQAAKALMGRRDESESARELLLRDLQEIFAEEGNPSSTFTDNLLRELTSREDRPWAEWGHGKGLSAQGLAKLLKAFDVRPGEVREGSAHRKGYRLEHLQDAFARYLPQPSRDTRDNPVSIGALAGSPTRDNVPDVAGAGSDEKPTPAGIVADVADTDRGWVEV